MCVVFMFVLAHIVAWAALGGGWRGASRAPFAVLLPALALILLQAVTQDSYGDLGLKVGTLVSWELGYFFLYICLRIAVRPGSDTQALPRR